jgi:hypothetical protein
MVKPLRIGWTGQVAGIGAMRDAYKFLMGKSEDNR